MAETFSILQRKLQELESDLRSALSIPPDRIQRQCHQLFCEEIRNKFLFLTSLLKAERASRPRNRQLQHIERRLEELEAAFRLWESSKLAADFENGGPENVSTCSCTESCLNDVDDGEEADACSDDQLGLIRYDESAVVEEIFGCLGGEAPPAPAERSREKERRRTVGVFVGGMVFGMTLMGSILSVLVLSGSLGYVEHSSCLLPT